MKSIGIRCWKNKSTGTYDPIKKCFRNLSKHQERGIPDILGYMPDGRFIGIEVKTDKGKLTPEQAKFISDALSNNCISFVSRSVEQTFDQLKMFYPTLTEFDNIAKKHIKMEDQQ